MLRERPGFVPILLPSLLPLSVLRHFFLFYITLEKKHKHLVFLQTREQLQVELSSCQAKIVDLEKALAERGQVTKTRDGDRSSLVLLSLALLHVCLAALLLGWRYADHVCRRIL